MATQYPLGVDLGGTKIEIVALDAHGPRAAAPARARAARRLRRRRWRRSWTWFAMPNASSAAAGGSTIGIGTPGSMSRATGSCAAPIRCGSTATRCATISSAPRTPGAPHQRRQLLRAFRSRSTARAAAAPSFSASFSAPASARASSCDGRCSTGPTRSPESGATIRCRGPRTTNARARRASAVARDASRRGSSGPGLARDHRRVTGSTTSTAIVAAATAGDAVREASIARYEDRLARALAHVINLLDPDVIVLGGGMSNVDRLYVNVPALWGRWIFSDRVDTRLVRACARRLERRARRRVAVAGGRAAATCRCSWVRRRPRA